jgi:hypothetical protein
MSGPTHSQLGVPTLRSTALWSAFASLVTFALFTLFWTIEINPYYFPYGDSFALFVNSAPRFHPLYSSWFLHGFQTYFGAYPDMSVHASNFIRPVVNGTFFLGWYVYGSHWSRYLLTTYGVIGLLAGTTCFIARHLLKLSIRITSLAVLCVIIAPSVDSGAIFDPTFAFDLLGGLLVLLATAALIADALIPCWILLALAIFTKETTLFAPVLTAAILFVRNYNKPILKRLAISGGFLLPLAIWMGLRWYDFRGEKGVYVLMGSGSHGPIHVMLVHLLIGLTIWPIAAVVYWSSIPLTLRLLEKVSLVINLIFWAGVATAMFRKLLKRTAPHRDLAAQLRTGDERYAVAILTLFCASSLLLPLLLNVPRRFGGVFYPLFLLCLAYLTQHARNRGWRAAAAATTVAVGITGAILIVADIQHTTPGLRPAWALSHAYVSQLSTSTEPILFLVDDLSGGFSSDDYVKQFSGYSGQLIRVNDLQWNYSCDVNSLVNVEPQTADNAIVTSNFPIRCGNHVFSSVFPPLNPAIISFTRELPEATLHYDLASHADALHPTNKDNTLRIELTSLQPGSSVLIADPLGRQYRKIPLAPASETQKAQ